MKNEEEDKPTGRQTHRNRNSNKANKANRNIPRTQEERITGITHAGSLHHIKTSLQKDEGLTGRLH